MTTLLRLMMDADQLVILGADRLAADMTDPHVFKHANIQISVLSTTHSKTSKWLLV